MTSLVEDRVSIVTEELQKPMFGVACFLQGSKILILMLKDNVRSISKNKSGRPMKDLTFIALDVDFD